MAKESRAEEPRAKAPRAKESRVVAKVAAKESRGEGGVVEVEVEAMVEGEAEVARAEGQGAQVVVVPPCRSSYMDMKEFAVVNASLWCPPLSLWAFILARNW